jgi:hypothetical protein
VDPEMENLLDNWGTNLQEVEMEGEMGQKRENKRKGRRTFS